MLHNDVFVFDNVVHMYDLSDANIVRPDGGIDRGWHMAISAARRPKGQETIYGDGNPHTSFARPMIEWFWKMQVPTELQERYGYPAITDEDKRKILGGNQARLFEIDPARALAKKSELGGAA